MERQFDNDFEQEFSRTIKVRFYKSLALALFAAVLVVLSLLTIDRSGGWQDREAIRIDNAMRIGYLSCCKDVTGIISNGGGLDEVIAFAKAKAEEANPVR